MGYSVKWVNENLGITRDMLRYYEKEKLLSIETTRNPSNQYRDFNEEDIERIWAIKLLISIGFSAKEIRALMDESDFSFYEVMSEKVEKLEKKYHEIVTCLEFAKTIKMTGRIPNTTKAGIIRFDDFIEYARKNWNVFSDHKERKFMEAADILISKPSQEWSVDDVERIAEIWGDIDPEQMVHFQTISGYYRVLADMKGFEYDHDTVQCVVSMLYEYLKRNFVEYEYKAKYTPLYFADHIISTFIDSGVAILNERNYGKEECLFIARAIAYFGGYDFENINEI